MVCARELWHRNSGYSVSRDTALSRSFTWHLVTQRYLQEGTQTSLRGLIGSADSGSCVKWVYLVSWPCEHGTTERLEQEGEIQKFAELFYDKSRNQNCVNQFFKDADHDRKGRFEQKVEEITKTAKSNIAKIWSAINNSSPESGMVVLFEAC